MSHTSHTQNGWASNAAQAIITSAYLLEAAMKMSHHTEELGDFGLTTEGEKTLLGGFKGADRGWFPKTGASEKKIVVFLNYSLESRLTQTHEIYRVLPAHQVPSNKQHPNKQKIDKESKIKYIYVSKT